MHGVESVTQDDLCDAEQQRSRSEADNEGSFSGRAGTIHRFDDAFHRFDCLRPWSHSPALVRRFLMEPVGA
jgi:hypothetical protein